MIIDGELNDWTDADRLDPPRTGNADWQLYGRVDGDRFVFALHSLSGVAIGAGTTFWLNTDRNAATGYQIFGQYGGAEYNVNFFTGGIPYLYTGADGQNVASGPLEYAYGAGNQTVEFSVPFTSIGTTAGTADVFVDVNNSVFLPGSYAAGGYTVKAPASSTGPVKVGALTLDGSLADWSAADRVDGPGTKVAGHEVYGRLEGDTYVVAIKSNVAIGAGSTIWLNTDRNAATGYQVFGTSVGAEYNINFGNNGMPALYTGAAGATPTGGALPYGLSADGTVLEIAIPKSAIGSPTGIDFAADVNDATFLPGDYASGRYTIRDTASYPVPTGQGKKVGIVFSETTAERYFGLADHDVNKTAYSQLFMTAQSQCMAAGLPFDILTEADLKDITKIANYSTIVFPSFTAVKTADYLKIQDNLAVAVNRYHIGLVASGDFMTNDENGNPLPGDPYERMKGFFDLTRVNGGTAVVDVKANDVAHPAMQGYAAGELIRHYDGLPPTSGESGTGSAPPPTAPGIGWATYGDATPGDGPAHSVLDVQTVNGVNYDAVVATTTGGRNVHFSTASQLGDNNQLQNAIQWSVDGTSAHLGLQITRNAAIFAARNDMDQAQQLDDVRPLDDNGQPIPNGGIYDKLLPILAQWKADFNFVGSYYIDIGAYTADQELTNWAVSKPYFDKILALGNEIGSHSYTHPQYTDLLLPEQVTDPMLADRIAQYHALLNGGNACACPFCMREGANQGVVNQLKALNAEQFNQIEQEAKAAPDPSKLDPIHLAVLESTFYFQFGRSKEVIDKALGLNITGAAVPGMPEKLPTSIAILSYYSYLSGGYSSVGAGYPGAFGYLTPDVQNKVYLAPNMSFDFSLIDFQHQTPEKAQAIWTQEFTKLTSHGDASIIEWPWHDYGATAWVTPGGTDTSKYNLAMFTNFLAFAYAAGVEFVTLDDLAQRISAFHNSNLSYTSDPTGTSITATLSGPDSGKFALDLDNSNTIKNVTGWYAYDKDSVFTTKAGGTYAINLGATPDDVTHITALPSRSELLSVTGDGTKIAFSVVGEGKVEIDLIDPAGRTPQVTGATIASLVGDKLELSLVGTGQHDVSVTLGVPNTAPVITSDGRGPTAALSLAENGTAVTTVTATDPDAGQTLTYSLVAGSADAAKFAINATTGVLAFVAAPNFEAPGDAGANNVYDVTVQVSDGTAVATQALAVTVTDLNDTAPSFTSPSAVSMPENTTAVVTLASTDADRTGEATTYSLVAGAGAAVDNGLFEIVSGNQLKFVAAPDYEGKHVPTYTVNVQASDGVNSSLQTLTVTVTDVPETLPGTPTTGDDQITYTSPDGRTLIDGLAGTDRLTLTAPVFTLASAGSALTFDIASNGTTDLTVTNVEALALSGKTLILKGDLTAGGLSATTPIAVTLADGGAKLDASGLTSVQGLDVRGGTGIDTIIGSKNADRLDGGTGADKMTGGLGNDTYVVDNAADTVAEAANGGTDTVLTSLASYILGANVENLTYAGTGAFTGTGNALANAIIGGAGNDTLDGKAGADTLIGGLGDDTYVVDNAGDGVTEQQGEGIDTVQSSVTYALGTNVENLTLTGTASINGTGNDLANVLTGNGGSNILDGGAGADTLKGGAGNDTYVVDDVNDVVTDAANGGTDLVRTSLASYGLGANVENLTFTGTGNFVGTGNALANTITGGAGNDRLDGGAGADKLVGGAGDDTYVVDNAGDTITEGANAGTDTVETSLASYTLAANLENLVFKGTVAFTGTGNAAANAITGGAGNDALNGMGGADRLEGGAGSDTLTGGAGADTFVFDAPNGTSTDRVMDFNATQGDHLAVHGSDYGLLGALDPDWFETVATATAGGTKGHAEFIYNSASKTLLWDADGAGAGAAVAVATFATKVALHNTDLLVV